MFIAPDHENAQHRHHQRLPLWGLFKHSRLFLRSFDLFLAPIARLDIFVRPGDLPAHGGNMT